jgi:hypothetical protein
MKHHFGDCWLIRPLVWNVLAVMRKDLNVGYISTKFVLWLLTDEPKQQHVPETVKVRNDEVFVYGVMTVHKTCDCLATNKPSTRKWPYCPHPKQARQVMSNVKGTFVIFFYCEGTLYWEFVPVHS